ncbi:response regulator [Noviherbaspirillum suwonense]|uniref:histidine kinase n=1 Tax=Noviherbaspirillum suwonense TaxID=1224511 RepID=A0ABY1PSI4_9BURK|nr:response regulator [Noviherbaspirillum suwonense]SMP45749.1 Signal transduction histidine kinase [Noviherbaspirillum suwonense]
MQKTDTPKILIVNDDPASLFALASLLSRWAEDNGCAVLTARSGEEALRQVLQHEFAVILLDVNMPGMDGFETAEAIHSRPRSAAIPIIFITAYLADEMHRLKGYEKGAVDYLFTPVIPQMLQAKVGVFVAMARKTLELQSHAEALRTRTLELSALNERLEQEKREREAAVLQNRAKDEFLAMLGHELRNPLSAISSAATLIGLEGVSPESARRAQHIIGRQCQHLSHIVDDLLDLGRVMSGKILLERKRFDLSALLATCMETLSATGRTRDYTVRLESAPAWVDADPTRVEQIIINLLDNAFKYTAPGGVVEIAAGVDGGDALLEVRDSGVGIAPELLPHVFDVFVQGESSLDRAQGGMGIGLALVHQLVGLHDGSIAAFSDGAGKGSRFVLRLPEARAPSAAPAPSTALADAAQADCCALIVEDNEDGREMMVMLLDSFGIRVLQAADGAAGLEAACTHLPDIALVDLGLPGMDGYEVARRLRATPATRGMRLVALTGYGLYEDQQRALQAGFDLHLVKPVPPERLREVIASCRKAPVIG